MIYQTDGNVFFTPSNITISYLASADKILKDNISLQLNKLYPQMIHYFLNTPFTKGHLYGYTDPLSKRNIINIVTKNNFSDDITYESIEQGIYGLKKLAEAHRIKNVAYPKIVDENLNWSRIYYILAGAFSESPTNIIIYNL